MTLKNTKLIQMITAIGEDRATELLQRKLDDDEARKEYHRKYNAKKNAVLKQVKLTHPELFKIG